MRKIDLTLEIIKQAHADDIEAYKRTRASPQHLHRHWLLEHIAKLEAQLVWQPIETAPKDGTTVMLWGIWAGEINGPTTTPSGPFTGYFSDGKSDYEGDDWWDLVEGDAYACWCRPTHWMPLPEPPATSV